MSGAAARSRSYMSETMVSQNLSKGATDDTDLVDIGQKLSILGTGKSNLPRARAAHQHLSTLARTSETKSSLSASSYSDNAGNDRAPRYTGATPGQLELLHEEILQEWEGRIVSQFDGFVTAHLVDVTMKDRDETQIVNIPANEFSDSDLKILRQGSIFRWLIGYRYTRGTTERFARIVVRRLPMWTADEILKADKEARELVESIRWD